MPITPDAEAKITVGDHELFALVFNEELKTRPVIFLHGVTASIRSWTSHQPSYLCDCLTWYSLSLPGHYPGKFADDFTAKDFNADTLAEITASAIRGLTGGEPAILVGHSTGGFMALNVARYAPDLVHSVASISGFGWGKWRGFIGLNQRMFRRGILGDLMFNAEWMTASSIRGVYRNAQRLGIVDEEELYDDPLLAQLLSRTHRDFRRHDREAMAYYFRYMPDIDITDQLDKIKVPVMVMTGSDDPFVDPDQSEQIANATNSEDYYILKGLGHFPMLEWREVYDEFLSRWLMKVTQDDPRKK
jgi:pimeloyl-ACP methyl ester carboxylesterase